MTAMGAVLFAGPEAGAYLPSQLLNNFEARLSRITASLWTPDRAGNNGKLDALGQWRSGRLKGSAHF